MLRIFRVLKHAIRSFFDDNVVTLSAGLAFYSALSLAPLLMLLLAATEFLSDELAASVIAQIHLFVGERAGKGLTLVMESTRQQSVAGLVAGFGAVAMLLSATMAFTHLQSSLNRIWKVKGHRSQVVRWLLARAMSLGLVLGIGLLLLVSLMVTTVLRFLLSDAGLWALIDAGVSLLMYALLFGLIYWLLPSVSIGWRDVVMGAVVTAILFGLGKWGIGRYLSYASIGSVYGAAGSIMVLLVWIYYASIVFFFGAEITHAYARLYGSLRNRRAAKQ